MFIYTSYYPTNNFTQKLIVHFVQIITNNMCIIWAGKEKKQKEKKYKGN